MIRVVNICVDPYTLDKKHGEVHNARAPRWRGLDASDNHSQNQKYQHFLKLLFIAYDLCVGTSTVSKYNAVYNI